MRAIKRLFLITGKLLLISLVLQLLLAGSAFAFYNSDFGNSSSFDPWKIEFTQPTPWYDSNDLGDDWWDSFWDDDFSPSNDWNTDSGPSSNWW